MYLEERGHCKKKKKKEGGFITIRSEKAISFVLFFHHRSQNVTNKQLELVMSFEGGRGNEIPSQFDSIQSPLSEYLICPQEQPSVPASKASTVPCPEK